MNMTQAVVGKLLATPAFTAVVGDRLFPGAARQGAAFPRAVYSAASRLTERTFTGVVDLNVWRMTVTVYARTQAEIEAGGEAIVGAFDGFSGRVGGGLLRVQGAFVGDRSDDHEEPIYGDDVGVFSQQVELTIHWNQAA